jgi:hypothetical protein
MQVSKFTVRTSDRRLFRRCKRKWGFLSSIKQNLQRKGTEQNINFWFGSAIHFAMEDYFGYNRFGDPRRALKAYYEAFDQDSLPGLATEHYDLGIGMLTYFLDWHEKHNKTYNFQTLWLDADLKAVEPKTEGAVPAVEQSFSLDLGVRVLVDVQTEQILGEFEPGMLFNGQHIKYLGFGENAQMYVSMNGADREVVIVPMHYHGTVDRVVVDKLGRWWILDYKTAKGADTNKLDTDDQISAYIWAAEQWFQHPIYGFIYLQLTKDVARAPKRLKSGELSVDKKQKTTYQLLRNEIIKDHGAVQKAPMKLIEFLNTLAEGETEEGDRFIRWDLVKRSQAQLLATYNHIMGELQSMINPNLYLYPNPTRDCIWDCPLRDVCIGMDDGKEDEVQHTLSNDYEPRPRQENNQENEWRSKIKWPDGELPPVAEDEFVLALGDFDVELPNTNDGLYDLGQY